MISPDEMAIANYLIISYMVGSFFQICEALSVIILYCILRSQNNKRNITIFKSKSMFLLNIAFITGIEKWINETTNILKDVYCTF